MRVYGQRRSHRNVVTGADKVLVGFPIPADGKLNNVHLQVHVLSNVEQAVHYITNYGIDVFVVPLDDPDSGETFDNLWDRMIPKDKEITSTVATAIFDLDTQTADTDTHFEIGESRLESLLGYAGAAPVRIFSRRKMVSFAARGLGYQAVAAGTDLWIPNDYFTTQIRRNVRVAVPSLVLVGFSNPNPDVTTVMESVPTESEWTLLRYLPDTLERAWMDMLGLTELGAETPYTESVALLPKILEPDVTADTAAHWAAITWDVVTEATFDITVPGRKQFRSLSAEGAR